MEILSGILGVFIASFTSIFAISNPLGAMPVFISLTENNTKKEQVQIAKKTAIYMFVILTIFLLAGTWIKNFFGISLAGIRVAGGLIILQSAFAMLNPKTDGKKQISKENEAAAKEKDDISLTPLAMPMMSGPGSIAVVIGMASNAKTTFDFMGITLAILLLSIVAFLLLRLAALTRKYLRPNMMNAVTRMMGFIVMAIAIQFILGGIKEFFVL